MDISNLVEERHHAEGEKRRRLPSINPSSTSTYPTALPPFSHISTLPPINYQWTWIDRVNSWIDSVTESVPISKENIQRAIQSQKAAVAAAVSLSSSPIELSFSRGLESEKSLKVNVSLLMSKQSNLFRVGLMRLMASLQKSTQISGDVVYSTVRLFDMYVSSRSTTIDLKSKMEIRGLISACVFLAAKYRTDDQLAGSDLQLMYTLQLSGSMLTLYLKYSNELVEMLQVHQKITEDVSIPSPMSFFRHYTYFFECNHGKLSKNVKLKAITLFDKSLAIMPTGKKDLREI